MDKRYAYPDPWYLPEIVSIEAVRVHFRKPVPHAVGLKRTETREAVELRVRTVEEFPVRALSPALFIGDVVVNEYSPADADGTTRASSLVNANLQSVRFVPGPLSAFLLLSGTSLE